MTISKLILLTETLMQIDLNKIKYDCKNKHILCWSQVRIDMPEKTVLPFTGMKIRCIL